MNDVVSLAKPRKKGLLHLIFSRFFLIVGLLILQLLIVITFYAWLRDLLPFFSVIVTLVTIGGVIYLFGSGMDSFRKADLDVHHCDRSDHRSGHAGFYADEFRTPADHEKNIRADRQYKECSSAAGGSDPETEG